MIGRQGEVVFAVGVTVRQIPIPVCVGRLEKAVSLFKSVFKYHVEGSIDGASACVRRYVRDQMGYLLVESQLITRSFEPNIAIVLGVRDPKAVVADLESWAQAHGVEVRKGVFADSGEIEIELYAV